MSKICNSPSLDSEEFCLVGWYVIIFLVVEAVCSSKKSLHVYQRTWHHFPEEDSNIQNCSSLS